MEYGELLRWFHILGATVLIGTGSGIAFFMVMAHRTKDASLIAHTAGIVVLADWIFTATAVVAQPITGILLARANGWDLSEKWILLSFLLYGAIGIFWLPVVWLQHQIRNLAYEADLNNQELPTRYFRYYRIWFLSGIPAFISILVILGVMVVRPAL